MGGDDDRRCPCLRRRPDRARLHLRRPRDGEVDRDQAGRRRDRPRRGRAATRLGHDGEGDSQPRPAGDLLDGDLGCRCRALGSACAAARTRRSAGCSATHARPCPYTAREVSPTTRTSDCRSSWRAGFPRACPESRSRLGAARRRTPGAWHWPERRSGTECELFVDANGAYERKQALALAHRFRRGGGRELV